MGSLKRLLVVLFLGFGTAVAVVPATPAVAQSVQDVEDVIDIRIAQLQAEIDAIGSPSNPTEQGIVIANQNRINQLIALKGVLNLFSPTVLQVLYEFFLQQISPNGPGATPS